VIEADSQKSCFGDSQKHPTYNEAFIGRNSGGAACNDTPRYHDSRDPSGRGKVFHGDIGREFEEDIWTDWLAQGTRELKVELHEKDCDDQQVSVTL
jgi:hypothetical protein